MVIKQDEKKEIVYKLDEMEWTATHDPYTPGTFWDKQLPVDEDLGFCVTRYPKGYYKTWHYHDMGHGIFVLKGKLRTESGVYGPGTLVWFPKGMVTRHGATDEEDCTFLFLSGAPKEIHFVEEDGRRAEPKE